MNVIVICLDTFRADLIGPDAKMSGVATPNLDALASESVSFERAYGEGQPTLQMRRAFFTGRRSFPWRYNYDRRGHWHHAPGWHKIPPEQDTLAEILVRRGYYTGLIADTYHMFKPTMNYTRGFCTYEFVRGQETDNWRGGTLSAIEAQLRKHTRGPLDSPSILRLAQYLWNQRGRQGEEDYQCARVFRAATRWLEDNADNAPFFLWIDSFDLHEPWDPPTSYADRYYAYEGIDYIYPVNEGTTPEERERIVALYCGEVTFVDKWAGAFLNAVDELKLWEDTVVVLTSDHGTQLLDHGRFGKGADELHPFNTQIPLYVRHPDGPRGRRVDAFVQSHDLAPTLLRLLDVPYANVDGQDAWTLVTGERPSLRDLAGNGARASGTDADKMLRDHVVTGWAGFVAGNAGGRASVRDEEWNYVVSVHEEDPNPELYHLPSDPDEVRDVHDRHPEVVDRQRARLEAVVGGPIPAQLNEVCDPASPPMYHFLRSRLSGSAFPASD
ncbi:MAG: sulfatase [Anaerolineae bacterium]|nr:sulfatase [Anaerolineae bacterium]